jgi:hypothetical protein
MSYTTSAPHRNGRDYILSPAHRRRNGHAEPRRVTGRNVAHAHRSTCQLAALAADIAVGRVELTKLTFRQICAIVGVSVPTASLALQLHDAARDRVARGEVKLADANRANRLATDFFAASSKVREAAGRAIGAAKVWDDMVAPNLSDN